MTGGHGGEPFFSVIVPAYNSAEFIRRGLESIRGQDFRSWELIVVCDSCTDNTREVALAYTDIVPVTDCHSAGGARNRGLDCATGEWVLFMDDDDWWLPGAFRRIWETVRSMDEIDILAFGFEWKHVGNRIQTRDRLMPAVWNKAWRRDYIEDRRFLPLKHTDDLEWARRMHPKAWIGFLPEVLYHYEFLRPGSVSEKIMRGEIDNTGIPEELIGAAEGYERWLKEKFL